MLIEKEKTDIEADAEEVSETEKTFYNPSDDPKHCIHCRFETKSDDDLEKHMQTKHEKRCPHCAFYTHSEIELENHMRNKHEKTLKCDYCEFVGKTLSGLKAHITKMHTGLKKFKCCTCNFCCETKSELVSHNDLYRYSNRQCLNSNNEK